MRLSTSPFGDSVGLRARGPGGAQAPLPTKTSGLSIQSLGRSPCFFRTCSHVFLTFWVVFSSRLIFVARILSSVSLALMERNHLRRISPAEWEQSCMTLSHRRTREVGRLGYCCIRFRGQREVYVFVRQARQGRWVAFHWVDAWHAGGLGFDW
jgi:hypothetical protein